MSAHYAAGGKFVRCAGTEVRTGSRTGPDWSRFAGEKRRSGYVRRDGTRGERGAEGCVPTNRVIFPASVGEYQRRR